MPKRKGTDELFSCSVGAVAAGLSLVSNNSDEEVVVDYYASFVKRLGLHQYANYPTRRTLYLSGAKGRVRNI